MPKTYIPSMVTDVHALNVYFARYGSALRAAVAIAAPSALEPLETLIAAVAAIDALRELLTPIGE